MSIIPLQHICSFRLLLQSVWSYSSYLTAMELSHSYQDSLAALWLKEKTKGSRTSVRKSAQRLPSLISHRFRAANDAIKTKVIRRFGLNGPFVVISCLSSCKHTVTFGNYLKSVQNVQSASDFIHLTSSWMVHYYFITTQNCRELTKHLKFGFGGFGEL